MPAVPGLLAWNQGVAASPSSRRASGVERCPRGPSSSGREARSLQTSEATLRVVGSCSPPFRPLTPAEDQAITAQIRASGAQIVFVGLGCPRQELWAAEHRAALQAALVWVGAAFDFHAGALRQAPPWMQARGLEWLFRLIMEPRRLWRRYLYAIPVFTVLVAQQFLEARVARRAV